MRKISEMLTKNHTPISFNYIDDLAAKRLDLDGPHIELGSDHLTGLGIWPENAGYNPLTGEVFSTDLDCDEAKELGIDLSELEDVKLLKFLKYSIEIPHEYHGHIGLTRVQNHYYDISIVGTFTSLILDRPFEVFLGIISTIHGSSIVQEYYALRKQKVFCTEVKFSDNSTLWDICRGEIEIQSSGRFPYLCALRMLETGIQNNWKFDLVDFSFHVGFTKNYLTPYWQEVFNRTGDCIEMVHPDEVFLCSQRINETELKECDKKEDQIKLFLEKMGRICSSVYQSPYFGSAMREDLSFYPESFLDQKNFLDLYPSINLAFKHGLITKKQYNAALYLIRSDSPLRVLLLKSYIVSRIEKGRWLRELYFDKTALKTTLQDPCGERTLKLAIELIKLRDRVFTPIMYLSIIKSPRGIDDYLDGTAKVSVPLKCVKYFEDEVDKNRECLSRILQEFN